MIRTTLLICALFLPIATSAPLQLELISVDRIWDKAPHSAFGDIIRFEGKWFCVFREAGSHVSAPGRVDDGKLRVIVSKDGSHWDSAALIAEPGIDLRDPHLSIATGGRLMIVAGGSEYPEGQYRGRQSRVLFSSNGTDWSAPHPVLEQGHWLWRVTWHKGRAYGVSKYGWTSKETPGNTRRVDLVTSADGIKWTKIVELKVPGGDETTVRFLPDGRMAALMRNTLSDGDEAMIGVASPPFTEWLWSKSAHFVGGPNFIVLPSGAIVAGGRFYSGGPRLQPRTAIGPMTLDSYEPVLMLPSAGDSSYPGFAWHDGVLWTLYYSSHESRTSIYLAKIRVKP